MSDKQEPSVLGALPHSRPHRRSARRPTRPAAAESGAAESAATKPVGRAGPAGAEAAAGTAPPADAEPAAGAAPTPPPAEGEECSTDGLSAAELLTTAVQAAAELAEIGLTAGARALRIAVSRLPRP